uniref:Uncharacterized protein n=1 Tax=Ralstonia syzygii R24 TaxID=907261 RepID=G2ZY60_9RALS|nr:hypothetical protein RALSY_11263 [Ralstonia syzygii R24]
MHYNLMYTLTFAQIDCISITSIPMRVSSFYS